MSPYPLFSLLLLLSLILLLGPVWRNSEVPKKQRLLFIVMVSGAFFTGALLLYAHLGTPQILPLLAQRETRLAELKRSILQRSEDVKANPDNLPAWGELGNSFMETSQYAAAANAFKQAVILSHGDPQVIVAYAQALISEADGKVTDDAKKSLDMALMQQSDNALARYFIAVRELQEGETSEAMQHMQALYHSLPADSPVKAMIDKQIGR